LANSFAQQANTPDPQLRDALAAFHKKYDEVFDSGDAAALAALYRKDAVEVTNQGPIYGREAIEKHYAALFQNVHFSNHVSKADQYSPYIIGTAGNEAWSNGEWSTTFQVKGGDPAESKGYLVTIFAREGDAWKKRLLIWNLTPPPAK
jgi:ketosteroid isomerase-like protein